jgi:H+/Cl- antiporter ClcA
MNLGKLLIASGAVLILAGLFVVLLDRANVPLGKLPGDIVYRGKNTAVYFPIVSSIVISVVLSAVLYVISRSRR